jgi:hypothetical protein
MANSHPDGCLVRIAGLAVMLLLTRITTPLLGNMFDGLFQYLKHSMHGEIPQSTPQQPQYVPVPEQPQYVPVPIPIPQQPTQTCNIYGCGLDPNIWGASPNGTCTIWGCP